MDNALPVKFWGLDPLHWIHVKLFVRDVLQLKNYPGFKEVYAISNHPIVQVLVVGYIVKVDKKLKLTNYGVDDGTGFLSCCMWHDRDNGMDLVEANFGDLVTVMGRISTFREERQMTISTLHVETDANVEVLHWLEVMKLSREIYEKPFVVPVDPNTQSTAKPWLKDELEIEIDRLEELLKSAIAEFLGSSDTLLFTMDTIRNVENVPEIIKQLTSKYKERDFKDDKPVKEEVKKIPPALMSRKDVEQRIKHALRKLEKAGIVYCKPMTDFGKREYEHISVKKDLSPRIACVIRDVCNSEDVNEWVYNKCSECVIPHQNISNRDSLFHIHQKENIDGDIASVK